MIFGLEIESVNQKQVPSETAIHLDPRRSSWWNVCRGEFMDGKEENKARLGLDRFQNYTTKYTSFQSDLTES
jgi:hypothetical protein